jgi:hypothetical protein
VNNIEYEYQGLMTDFSRVGGVGIMGFISPMDTMDTYAVIDPIYGIDGLRNIDTLNELNDIPFERRRSGMLVGVEGGGRYFKLRDILWTFQLTDWEEIFFSTSSATTPSTDVQPYGSFIDREKIQGIVDGINQNFTLKYLPSINSEHLFLNGLLQDKNDDYVISGKNITFIVTPPTNSKLRCSYRTYSDINFVDREIPMGEINGININFTLNILPKLYSEHIYLNGLLQDYGADDDYLIDGKNITFNIPPPLGSRITVSYRYV